jgi:hypothetical protein
MNNNRWTPEFLESKRRVADPMADAVIREVLSESVDADLKTRGLLNLLIENDDPVPHGLPEAARRFIEDTSELPEWADTGKLRVASRVFAMYGPEVVWILFCRSLPFCYACAKGANVLASTGRLNHPERDREEVLMRRIMETAQFVMDVLEPRGFSATGRAIAATRKIRLIHASIRYFLEQRGWDHERFGQPINQEDMAGTLLSFSVTVTDGLQLLHVPLTDEQQEAFLHLWKVVGHFIGVDADLLPEDVADARAEEKAILGHQIDYSEQGEALTQAIVAFLKDMLRKHYLRRFPEVLIRFMVGNRIADVLKVRRRRAHWPFYLFILLIRTLSEWKVRSHAVRAVSRKVNLIVLKALIEAQNPVKGTHFRIPPGLSEDWGLESA